MKLKRGDKILISLLAVLLVVSSGVVWYIRATQEERIAVIMSRGEVVERIDLNGVKEPYTITVNHGDDHAFNIVQVEPGRIRTIDATCPDKIDVHQGWIYDATGMIVCLPNELIIYIEGEDSLMDY